jgi:hypothetical protein
VADFQTSKAVFQTLPAVKKHFVDYQKSNHIILFDYDAQDAIERILTLLGTAYEKP